MDMTLTYKKRKISKDFYVDNPVQNVYLTPKALNMDSPVQALGAARGNGNPPLFQPRSGLNSYGVPVWQVILLYPELRFACEGLSVFKTYGLVFDKQSPVEHILNLLKLN